MLLDADNTKSAAMNEKYVVPGESYQRRHIIAHNAPINHLTYTHSGLFIVSQATDGFIRVWSALSGRHEFIHMTTSNRSRINRFALSLNDQFIYAPNLRSVDVYERSTGRLRYQLKEHFERVNVCVCNELTGDVYSGGDDHSIVIYEPAMPRRVEPQRVNDDAAVGEKRSRDDDDDFYDEPDTRRDWHVDR